MAALRRQWHAIGTRRSGGHYAALLVGALYATAGIVVAVALIRVELIRVDKSQPEDASVISLAS